MNHWLIPGADLSETLSRPIFARRTREAYFFMPSTISTGIHIRFLSTS